MAKPRQIVTAGPTSHGLEYIQSKNPGEELFAVSGGSSRISARECLFPVVSDTSFGQPAVLFRGKVTPFGGTDGRVLLARHTEQGVVAPQQELFPYDTFSYGLVQWAGALLAICGNANFGAVSDFVHRISYDSGVSWTQPAAMLAMGQGFASGIGDADPALWITTSRDGKTLYIFYYLVNTRQIYYRYTTSADPTLGWSAGAYTGITTQLANFNMGNDTAEGLNQRCFIFCETSVPGVWAAAFNDGTGTVADDKAIYTGALGGLWFKQQDMGFGGGISGFSGGTGGVYLDGNGYLHGYAMSDQVDTFTVFQRNDRLGTWSNESNEVPPFPALGFGAGQGLYVPSYNKTMIWGHSRSDGSLRVLVVDNIPLVTNLGGGV